MMKLFPPPPPPNLPLVVLRLSTQKGEAERIARNYLATTGLTKDAVIVFLIKGDQSHHLSIIRIYGIAFIRKYQ